jgi:hypothetical protein
MITAFRSVVNEIYDLLECYAVYIGSQGYFIGGGETREDGSVRLSRNVSK